MSHRPFALERYFARHEFSARYLLGSSDPESITLGELLAFEPGSREAFEQLWLGYTESQGDPELRRLIAAQYEAVSPDQVLVFTGAEEPIFAFMHAALGPGDHLIVHFPGYQSHYGLAEDRGIGVSRWMGDPERGWALDPEGLEALIRRETRAILVCGPHNPTGFLFEPDAWQRVIEIARKHGLWLFSDEVYRGLEHDPAQRLAAAVDRYEKAVSLNCLSKTQGLPGLRLGWIATRDAGLYDRLAAFKDHLTICNSAPSEFLGRIALRHTPALWERNRSLLQANLGLLEAFFQRQPQWFRWRCPRAGTTTFPRFLGGDAQAFCDRLIEDTGIMLVPSSCFDLAEAHLRFGYGRVNLPEVLPRLEAWLARL